MALAWPDALPPLEGELIVLDGMSLDGFTLLPEDYVSLGIVHVDSLAADRAIARWGDAGRQGAVVLRTGTRDTGDPLHDRISLIEAVFSLANGRDPAPSMAVFIDPPPSRRDRPIVLVEGTVMRVEEALRVVDGKRIVGVHLARGERVAQLYGRNAWYGLVALTLGGNSN